MKTINMKTINMKTISKKQKGFTLIEILIVIAIISTLLVAAVSSFGDKPGEARIATAKQSIGVMTQALKIYRLDNINFPATGGLKTLVPKYLDKLGKLAAFAGVAEFPVRVKCATLAWHTMHNCLHNRPDMVTTEEDI